MATTSELAIPVPIQGRAAGQLLDLEWLVANGIGGYASSTVLGANTRRYHALLCAALRPPGGRTALLAKVDEELAADDGVALLGVNEYADGTIYPRGDWLLQSFDLELGLPRWRYAWKGRVLEKRVFMPHGFNQVYLRYRLLAGEPCTLRVNCFATARDMHAVIRGTVGWRFHVAQTGGVVALRATATAPELRLVCSPGGAFRLAGDWYWDYHYRRERERGLEDAEDYNHVGWFEFEVERGREAWFTAWSGPRSPLAATPALEAERARRHALPERSGADDPLSARLVLAADTFVVAETADEPATGIIAGYHWFERWGRDTFISLPGLLLETGRSADARSVLRHWFDQRQDGLLPSNFAADGAPSYDSVDASLWAFTALERYLATTGDADLLQELLPALREVCARYRAGTGHGIVADPVDGLLRTGRPDMQTTWMDAKVDGCVITPREGKPIEVNALWLRALHLLAAWGADPGLEQEFRRAAALFARRFWSSEHGYFFDVFDGPGGDDASLRPNQVIACALLADLGVIPEDQLRAVLDVTDRALLTPPGLRTLAPDDRAYAGRCSGDQRARDNAYHQGTVWPWLLGPYCDLARHLGVPEERLARLLRTALRALDEYGLGQVGEIFDGDPPHSPRGCVAQAWSVAELFRAWRALPAALRAADDA